MGYVDGWNTYAVAGQGPIMWLDPSGAAVQAIVCAGACAGCTACSGPGIGVCLAYSRSWKEFKECYDYYWSLPPRWHRWCCTGVCEACVVCVARKLKPKPRLKPGVTPKPRPRPVPKPRPGPNARRCKVLKMAKIAACKTASTAGGCGNAPDYRGLSGDQCHHRAMLWSACCTARQAYQRACFKKGDAGWGGHQQQIGQCWATFRKCWACSAPKP